MGWDFRLSTVAFGLLYYPLGDNDVNEWVDEIG
jgi:hypothetical protein